MRYIDLLNMIDQHAKIPTVVEYHGIEFELQISTGEKIIDYINFKYNVNLSEAISQNYLSDQLNEKITYVE